MRIITNENIKSLHLAINRLLVFECTPDTVAQQVVSVKQLVLVRAEVYYVRNGLSSERPELSKMKRNSELLVTSVDWSTAPMVFQLVQRS